MEVPEPSIWGVKLVTLAEELAGMLVKKANAFFGEGPRGHLKDERSKEGIFHRNVGGR